MGLPTREKKNQKIVEATSHFNRCFLAVQLIFDLGLSVGRTVPMTSALVIFIFNLPDPKSKISRPVLFEIRPDPKIIFQQKFYFQKIFWIISSQ